MDNGLWLKPLGDVFLGLNTSAVIRRVFGAIDIAPSLNVAQLPGLSWRDFVAHYADQSVQDGLNYAWLAMAKGHVARAYWPLYLPFKQGVIARMRPVDDPIISFVIHLSPVTEYNLVDLISEPLLSVMDRMIATSQEIFSGVGGPLTDRQVKDIGDIVRQAEHTRQLLYDLRAEVLLPATTPPMPYPVTDLFTFAAGDFTRRRITTHRLSIQSQLSVETVYCQSVIRAEVHQIIDSLIACIAAESAITISDTVDEDAQTVQIAIQFQSREPALQIKTRVDPVDVSDPVRLSGMRSIQRFVTAVQSRLKPINGHAWAEPIADSDSMARIVLVLPRWADSVQEL
ncbi:MAG: hypothetical protein JXA10_15945 [Anaerolineae bacterium]|nr:hypothetical protein [Anaerolineae bacterium]